MVSGEENQVLPFADLLVQVFKKFSELSVQPQVIVFYFYGRWAKPVPDVTRGRKADRKEIGLAPFTQLFSFQCGISHIQGERIAKRRGTDHAQSPIVFHQSCEVVRERRAVSPDKRRLKIIVIGNALTIGLYR